jgi:tripartite-type tricarboxylate transporter receptor subunit TctC
MVKTKSILSAAIVIMIVSLGLLMQPSILWAADQYPSKPVRYVIPHAPGAGNDLLGRMIAGKLSERLGKSFVVDNHDGAGGRVGVKFAQQQKPDGYTLLFTSISIASSPALYKTEDPLKLFTPIARVATGPLGIVVHPSLPVKTAKELLDMIKRRPGEMIMASSSAGSINHMAALFFKGMTGVDFKVVIFKGGGPAVIDLLGSHSHFMFGTLPLLMSYINSGALRPIATTGLKRTPMLPNVGVVADILPGYEISQWWGLFAPIGTPAPIVDRLGKEIKQLVTLEDVKKQFLAEGADIDYLGPAEFRPFLVENIAQWHEVVKTANIQAE